MPNWCKNTLIVSCSKEHKADLQKFKKQVIYVGEILISKDKIQEEYEKYMDNIEMWRNRLEDWLKYKQGTAKEYFLREKGSSFNENGDIVETYSEFSFHGIISRPDTKNCYNWSCNNWGTQWDACESYLYEENKTNLAYSFDTAWSPPLPVIEKAAELFPNLHFDFSYGESGCDFAGEIEYENGECVRQAEGTYIEIYGECNDCGSELTQVDGKWNCPECEKKVCTCCYTPYNEGETSCEKCGNGLE